jgi:hypothetical protein
MIYQIVDIRSGVDHGQSVMLTEWFDRKLSHLNRGSLGKQGFPRYALACHLPVKICVYCRLESRDGDPFYISWHKWIRVDSLPWVQRNLFWRWYANTWDRLPLWIPASELLIRDIRPDGTIIYNSNKIDNSICNGCAYLMQGNPSICNAFHPQVGLDECPDFLREEIPDV